MYKIKNLGRYFSVFIFAILSLACSNTAKENTALIRNAVQKIRDGDNADETLRLLRLVETSLLSEDEYAYFVLVQVRAWDLADVNIAMSDRSVIKAKDYFEKTYNAPKAALARFILGRVYEKQGYKVKAQHNYMEADDLGEKANYRIGVGGLNYSNIPYNIAVILHDDGQFMESSDYCHKALVAVRFEYRNHVGKLNLLELRANNYVQLNNIDSALVYYDRALEIANKHNIEKSSLRIGIGKISAISKITDDYARAEQEYKRLLSIIPANDSILAGHIYTCLSDIYMRTQRIDSSLYFINQSKQLLANADLSFKLPLYRQLYTVEKENGNTAAANEFEMQYKLLEKEQLKEAANQTRLDKIRQEASEKEAPIVCERLLDFENNWFVSQSQISKKDMLTYVLFACIAIIVFFILREKKLLISDSKKYIILKFEKETLVRNALQRKDMIRLRSWVSKNQNDPDLVKLMLKKIEDLMPKPHWIPKPKLYAANYRPMVFGFKADYPYLNELECSALCLICTNFYTNEEKAEILDISLEHSQQIEKSIQDKLNNNGLMLKKVIMRCRIEYGVMPFKPTDFMSELSRLSKKDRSTKNDDCND